MADEPTRSEYEQWLGVPPGGTITARLASRRKVRPLSGCGFVALNYLAFGLACMYADDGLWLAGLAVVVVTMALDWRYLHRERDVDDIRLEPIDDATMPLVQTGADGVAVRIGGVWDRAVPWRDVEMVATGGADVSILLPDRKVRLPEEAAEPILRCLRGRAEWHRERREAERAAWAHVPAGSISRLGEAAPDADRGLSRVERGDG